eukprot:GFUD01002552.1.p1 GENE.GFUD01002552.1~~GFUD01002552.1.p1  ORF type:complete len:202 (+),score=63.81 GFUD01002552.1:407-1012(+)
MDSRDSNVQQNHPTLCKNGCGFYSNAGNEGLCSVCYKDIVKKKQAPPTNMPASFSPAPNSMASLSIEEGAVASSMVAMGGMGARPTPVTLDTATPTVPVIPAMGSTEKKAESDLSSVAGSSLGGPEGEKDGEKDGKKKKSRCLSCKKKVGLTGFTCRCGGLFCSIHRYSDKHECGFDYKALGAEEISKSNPVVVAQKVAKI